MKNCFYPAEIALPDFSAGKTDGTKWAVVACDQFTSEPEYWKSADALVGDAPSVLRLILPETWLGEAETRIPAIRGKMDEYVKNVLKIHDNCLIYLERTQSDGTIRRGLIGMVDLDAYDYTKGATSLIRATEGTVLERIPPRQAVRRGAALETPHVMMLIDDPHKTVIEPLAEECGSFEPAYDFDLMAGGGHVKAFFVPEGRYASLDRAMLDLIAPDAMIERYGTADLAPLLFAVGDGNHSLASAKACYEEIKAEIGAEAAQNHPARYALCEVVNLHDPAMRFEPIYRVVFDVDTEELLRDLEAATASLSGSAAPQTLTAIRQGKADLTLTVAHPEKQLPIGTLQTFLDEWLPKHPGARIDYIHGEDSLRRLADRPDTVGFLFAGMEKEQLFPSVMRDGVLPRKTFSMGHAQDKRYCLECRKIK